MQVGAPALKHKPLEAAFAYLLFVVVVPQPRPERFAVLPQVRALLIGAETLFGHTFRLAKLGRFFLSIASCHTLGIWPGFLGSTAPVPRAACARFIRASSSDNSVSRACWYSSLTTSCGLAELNRYFSVRTSR